MSPRPAYEGTQAVQRAVRMLKAIGAVGTEAEPTLADLVRAVGLNKTTAYRLLTALEAEGLVERGGPGGDGYRLGPELLALASRALGSRDLRQAARAELLALAKATRETAHLEILVGRETLILDEALGNHLVGTTPSVGTRWPAHATSTGKVLLAALSEPELEARLDAPLLALTPRTITESKALRRELRRVREQGWAVGIEELEPGFMAVAVPVRSRDGQVAAAVGVGGPRVRLDAERLVAIAETLPACAARITERLGSRAPSAPGRTRRAPLAAGNSVPETRSPPASTRAKTPSLAVRAHAATQKGVRR